MLNARTPRLGLFPVVALLAFAPALSADDSTATFKNFTKMGLTLTMDSKAEDGLQVIVLNEANEPTTFTGGSQAKAALEVLPGKSVIFSLADRNEGSMVFQVQAPENQALRGSGSQFGLTFQVAVQDNAQVATLETDLAEQSICHDATEAYSYFHATSDGVREVRITQIDVAAQREAEPATPDWIREGAAESTAKAAKLLSPPSPLELGYGADLDEGKAKEGGAAAPAPTAPAGAAAEDLDELITAIDF